MVRDAVRILYCRHDTCGKPYESVGGLIPPICPACSRVAAWATDPDVAKIPGFPLTRNDKQFLKSLRIDPEG